MHYFNKYGGVAGDVHALNATQTAVMRRAGPTGSNRDFTTYVVENVTGAPMTGVDISDGQSVATVPARSVLAITIERNTQTGAIVSTSTLTLTNAIPDLSGAPTGPSSGAGTNLYLGYSQPAAPATATVDDAFTGRPLLRFHAFGTRSRRGTTVSVTEAADGSGFIITARTARDGRAYTRAFNGLTGAPIGVTIVTTRRHQ